MKHFAAGFAIASLIWLGAFYAQSLGFFTIFESAPVDTEGEDSLQSSALEDKGPSNRKRKKGSGRGKLRRNRPRRQPGVPTYDTGSGSSGDSLGSADRREVAMGASGGEEQLSSQEIERGIDTVWRGIERCLILVPSSALATGKVVVGMHITPAGKVTKANLKGPNVIIKGEPGSCIRKKVKSIQYPSFDGPDMVVNYPMFFD